MERQKEIDPKPTKSSLTYPVQQPDITDSEDKGNGVVKDWHGKGALDGHLGWGFQCTVRFYYTVRADRPLLGYGSTLFPTGFQRGYRFHLFCIGLDGSSYVMNLFEGDQARGTP